MRETPRFLSIFRRFPLFFHRFSMDFRGFSIAFWLRGSPKADQCPLHRGGVPSPERLVDLRCLAQGSILDLYIKSIY